MKIIFGLVIAASMVFLLLGPVSVADAGMGGGGGSTMKCSCKCGCRNSSCNCSTCSICSNKTTPVPEPSTFILFGSLLIGAFGVKKVITG